MKKVFAVVSTVLIFFAVSASAPSGQRTPGDFNGGNFMRHKPQSILNFAKELNLTPDQVEQLMAIEKGSNARFDRSRADLKEFMEQLRSEIEKDSPDVNKVDAIIGKISENHKDYMESRFHDILDIKKILTKGQHDMLKKIIEREKPWRNSKDGGEAAGNDAPEK